ncbi:hypothetical protein C0J52_04004 [Blattella germanica]|nr:hypothetical protein C0J52_04004 [Blattella germanica]
MFVFAPVDGSLNAVWEIPAWQHYEEIVAAGGKEFLDRCSGEAGVTKQFQLQIGVSLIFCSHVVQDRPALGLQPKNGAFHRSTVLDSYSEDFADLLYAVFNKTNSALLHILKISLDCCLKTTFKPFPGMSQEFSKDQLW